MPKAWGMSAFYELPVICISGCLPRWPNGSYIFPQNSTLLCRANLWCFHTSGLHFFLHSFIDTDLLYKILFLFFIAATFCILIIIIEAYIYDGLLNYCWLFGTTEMWKVDVPVLRGSVRWEHKPRASCTVRLWQFHTFHLRTACSIFCLFNTFPLAVWTFWLASELHHLDTFWRLFYL